ncbi:MAG: hypothetical protein SV377_02045, partial [Halobacteria archaeon]|nr:hypothetical protein [Halobacteria archaeon]
MSQEDIPFWKRRRGEEHHEGLPAASYLKRWLVTTNHKDIGILYILTSLFFLVFGGVLALLFRI